MEAYIVSSFLLSATMFLQRHTILAVCMSLIIITCIMTTCSNVEIQAHIQVNANMISIKLK